MRTRRARDPILLCTDLLSSASQGLPAALTWGLTGWESVSCKAPKSRRFGLIPMV